MCDKHPCDPELWIATLRYHTGSLKFGVSDSAFEMLASELTEPWIYLPLVGGGLAFVKTEGLEWFSITKNLCPQFDKTDD